ncbi:MAG: cupin domain-containing protein [Chloroflexi bacterium]|nr:cupin domain-containing protein [Chloroflexota bacterium]
MIANLISNWRDHVIFSANGPQPFVLVENERIKSVLVGLEPGQKLPPHPAPDGVYQFLEGTGWMMVDDERLRVQPGAVVVVPDGAKRGIEAETRLAFIGVRVP